MKKKVAITGGIGSGKSKALSFIRDAGYPTFSCDEIYREVIGLPEYVRAIAKIFPACVENDKIVRARLSKIVFSNVENREKLNAVAHPLIMERLYARMELCEGNLVFAEVPLLFEGGFEKDFDKIIVLVRDQDKRIASVMKRDGLSRAEILSRMQSQFSYKFEKECLKNCNIIFLPNEEGDAELKIKVNELLNSLSK